MKLSPVKENQQRADSSSVSLVRSSAISSPKHSSHENYFSFQGLLRSHIYGVDDKIVYTRDVLKNVEIIAKEIPGYRKFRSIEQLVESCEKVSIVVIVDKMYFVVKNYSTNEERVLEKSDRLMRSRSIASR